MAKRRKEKDEDEDKPFKLPKFDEEAFLKKERRNVKATFIAFLFGVLMAIICFGFYALMSPTDPRWILVLLVAIFSASFIRYIYDRIHLDMTDFTRRNWFSSFAIYLFTWMIILIVLVNPPFYDDEAPVFEVSVLPNIQELGGTVKIIAKITDNVEVDKNSVQLEIKEPNDNTTNLMPVDFEFENIIVIFEYENSENQLGDFSFSLTANDVNGLSKTRTGSFIYDDDTIETNPDTETNLTIDDEIEIEVNKQISPENFRVFYILNDGEEINVDRKDLYDKSEYETSPEYEGWQQDSEYNMTVFVEVSHYFVNINKKYSNLVQDSIIYSLSTGDDDDIGKEVAPKTWNWSKTYSDQKDETLLNYDHPKDTNGDSALNDDEIKSSVLLPHPNYVSAPGFELIVFIASLAAVILIFKYKKKDKRR
jgi:hypothetical protein